MSASPEALQPGTYALPAVGKPPSGQVLRKVAIEEHFNFESHADRKHSGAIDLDHVVRAI
jgi:hypothetical protein